MTRQDREHQASRAENEAPRTRLKAEINRVITRRAALRAMGLGAVSSLIVACLPNNAGPSPSGTQPGASAQPSAQARGGTIRMGSWEGAGIGSWLPWAYFAQDPYWNWSAQRLLNVSPDGTIVYDLAKSHTVSADGKEYTFTLVDGATWHDGRPVTAADVAFTYNTALKAKAGSTITGLVKPIAGSQAVIDDNTKDASGIQVINNSTIKFVLGQRNAQFLATTFGTMYIAPKHPFDGIALADYAKQSISTNLFIGSGPMKMVEYREKQFVNFEAYDKYVNGSGWKGRPAADKVSIRVYDSPTSQLTSTLAGEVDFNYFRNPTGEILTRLQGVQGMTARKSLIGFWGDYMVFNLFAPSTPKLKDKRVRQALVWALDRQTIVDKVLGGVPSVPSYMNIWLAGWANSDKLEKYHPQNVDRAKKLLSDAGWDSSVVLDVRHNPAALKPLIPVIVEMWKAVGVNVKLSPIPQDSLVSVLYGSKGPAGTPDQGPAWDIAFSVGQGTLDGAPWGADTYFGSSQVYPTGFNASRWNNAEWDREFAAALLATTAQEQALHFKRCSEIFNDELPFAPLVQRQDYAAISTKLRGAENAISVHPAAGGVRYWEWYMASS